MSLAQNEQEGCFCYATRTVLYAMAQTTSTPEELNRDGIERPAYGPDLDVNNFVYFYIV